MSDWITQNKGAGVWPFTKDFNKPKYNEAVRIADSTNPVWAMTNKDFGSTPVTPVHDPHCGYWTATPLEEQPPPPPSPPPSPPVIGEWVLRTTNYLGNWLSMAWGNNIYVAVSPDAPDIMTSPDGVIWTLRSSPCAGLYAIVFGNSKFVAVSESAGKSITSTDGITWTAHNLPNSNAWRAITYGKSDQMTEGLFVATSVTGIGNRIMTSPDGETWTLRVSPTDVSWNAICYGDAQDGGRFVGVSEAGWTMTSGNGIDWTLRTPSAFNEWQGIAFGDNTFVAVANHGTFDRVMWSDDGVNWTSLWASAYYSPYNFISEWFAIAYGEGTFVAVGIDGARIMISPPGANGTTWYAYILPSATPLRCVAFGKPYGSDKFVVAGLSYTGSSVMASANGQNWFVNSSSFDFQPTAIAYGNNKFVAVGTNKYIQHTSDGIYWKTYDGGYQTTWYGLTFGNDLFISVGYTGSPHGLVSSSPDGVVFTERHTSDMAGHLLVDVAYGNEMYVVISSNTTTVFTSTDGFNWITRIGAVAVPLKCIAFGNGVFVALATNDVAVVSSDGVIWQTYSTPSGFDWMDITFAHRQFVAVAGTGNAAARAMTSSDGITWSSRVTPGDGDPYWNSISAGEIGGYVVYVAVASSTGVPGSLARSMYSYDGITWSILNVPSAIAWYSLAYGNDRFVAVGGNGSQGAMTLSYN